MIDTMEEFPEGITSEGVLALHSAFTEYKDAVEQIRVIATTDDAIAQLDLPERVLLQLSSVPHCTAKLACGALMVGAAKELTDLRMNGQKVGVCCQEIRRSGMLKKWISTSFAVGNMLNRGTARSGVQAVVVPESLLKLEELRGNHSGDEADSSKKEDGFTALDFVAQALVDQDGVKEGQYLAEAEKLLAKARAASSVSLEETATNCKQIHTRAMEVKKGLAEAPSSAGVQRVAQRVNTICEEATLAVDIAQKAKEQLAKVQSWSSCKGKVSSDDFFKNWVQLLELLPRAFARAEETKARRLAEARTLKDKEPAAQTQKERAPLSDWNEDAKRVQNCLSLVKSVNNQSPQKSPGKQGCQEVDGRQRMSGAGTRARPKRGDEDMRIDQVDLSQILGAPEVSKADTKKAALEKENCEHNFPDHLLGIRRA